MARSRASIERRGLLFQMLDNMDENARWFRLSFEQIVAEVVTMIGREAYIAWCDLVLPDDEFSWKFLYNKVSRLKMVLEYPQLRKQEEQDWPLPGKENDHV